MSPGKVRSAFPLNPELFKKRLARSRYGRLVLGTMRRLGDDGAADMAASVSYYALMSVFPLLIGIIAVLGFFFPSELVQEELFSFFEKHLPTSVGLLRENISSIIKFRGTLGIVSVIGLFWSGSAIFASLGRAANRAWDVQQYRPFHIRKLRDFLLALGTGGVFFLSLGLTAILALVPQIHLPFGVALTAVIAEVAVSTLMFIAFLAMYKYVPNRTVAWRDVLGGALLGTIAFELIRNLFAWYLARFASFQLVYGSIASVIAFLVWLYLSAFALILGMEFSSEYARMKAESKPSS